MKKVLIGNGGHAREVMAQMGPKDIITIWNYHILIYQNLRFTKKIL
jgi:hypothetical protein